MVGNTQQPKTQKIPKLRFLGFSGAWGEKKLGDICDYKNGGAFENNLVDGGKYNLINLNSIDITGKLKNNHKTVNQADWYLQMGDLVMVLSDVAHGYFLGLVDVIPKNDKYVLNQRMGLLRKKDDDVDLNFLRLYINRKQHYFKLHGQGSSQQNLSKGDILKFKIPTPAFVEQQKIANFLMATDALIDNLRAQKESFELYKKGMMQKIFSQEIRLKDDKGKDFPKWEGKRLGEISDKITKGTTPTTAGFSYQVAGINFVKIESITDDGIFIEDKFAHISEDCNESFKRSQLKIGDILFSIAGALGRVALVSSDILPANTNQAIAIISPKSEIFPEYLMKVLRSHLIQDKIGELKVGLAQSNLSLAQISNFEIPLPSILEQQKIADLLTSLDKVIESKQQQITQVEQWKKGLMQGLFV